MNGDIGMDIAIPGVHVQGDEEPGVAHPAMNGGEPFAHAGQVLPGEDLGQPGADLLPIGLPQVAPQHQIQQQIVRPQPGLRRRIE
jgi:hypothetical protein